MPNKNDINNIDTSSSPKPDITSTSFKTEKIITDRKQTEISSLTPYTNDNQKNISNENSM